MLPDRWGHLVLGPLLHTMPRLPSLSQSCVIWWTQEVDPGKLGLRLSPLLVSLLICSSPNRFWGERLPLLLLAVLHHQPYRHTTTWSPRDALHCTCST